MNMIRLGLAFLAFLYSDANATLTLEQGIEETSGDRVHPQENIQLSQPHTFSIEIGESSIDIDFTRALENSQTWESDSHYDAVKKKVSSHSITSRVTYDGIRLHTRRPYQSTNRVFRSSRGISIFSRSAIRLGEEIMDCPEGIFLSAPEVSFRKFFIQRARSLSLLIPIKDQSIEIVFTSPRASSGRGYEMEISGFFDQRALKRGIPQHISVSGASGVKARFRAL